MAVEEIHVGDIGTELIVTIKDGDDAVDLSQATVLKMKFCKPSGGYAAVDAELVDGGTDGQMKHVTEEDFLGEAGLWMIQGYVELPGWKGHSSRQYFEVHPNCDDPAAAEDA